MAKGIKRLEKVISIIRGHLSGEIQAQQIHLLLLVAGDQGINQSKLMDLLALSRAAVSRNVRMLSTYYTTDEEGGEPTEAGLGLIETRTDLYDRKAKAVFLTSKGQALIDTLEKALDS